MNELYQAIEKKIKESGYPREISGQMVYCLLYTSDLGCDMLPFR